MGGPHCTAERDIKFILIISLPMIHQSFTSGLVKDTCPNCMKLVIFYLDRVLWLYYTNQSHQNTITQDIYEDFCSTSHSSWLLSSTTHLPECMIMIFVVHRWFHTTHLSSTLFNWQCPVQYLLVRIWQWAHGYCLIHRKDACIFRISYVSIDSTLPLSTRKICPC